MVILRSLKLVSVGLLISSISLFLFCKKDSSGIDASTGLGISGTVLDENGNPVKDVGIHLVFIEGLMGEKSNFHKVGKLSNIGLSSFEATGGTDRITLHWITDWENGNLGFEILRSLEANANYVQIAPYENSPGLAGQMNSTSPIEYSYEDLFIGTGQIYFYKLVDVDTSGIRTEHGPVSATVINPFPADYQLYQNYPNPFNPVTTIQFEVPEKSHILLRITSWEKNELIKTLIDDTLSPGIYAVMWNGKNNDELYVTNNLYRYEMIAPGFSDQKTMALQMVDPEHIRSLNAIPLVSTDSDGRFSLSFSSLPVGETIIWTDDQGNLLGSIPVAEKMSIFLIKDGYRSLVDEITVDGKTPVDKTFTLQSN